MIVNYRTASIKYATIGTAEIKHATMSVHNLTNAIISTTEALQELSSGLRISYSRRLWWRVCAVGNWIARF